MSSTAGSYIRCSRDWDIWPLDRLNKLLCTANCHVGQNVNTHLLDKSASVCSGGVLAILAVSDETFEFNTLRAVTHRL